MLTSGFTNAPVTRLLVVSIIVSALLASLTDTKAYLYIQVQPHLFSYGQFWRLLTWQLCYTNSTEVLFAAMTLYQLRVVERLWGSRKFASFLLSTLPYTTLLPPILLICILRPLTLGHTNYLPSGPTAVIFALLAQFHAAVPYTYRYRISSAFGAAAPSSQPQQQREYGMILTSKSTSYLLPAQLALSQFPGSLLAAGVGWVVGFAWRRDVLPGAGRWRVPDWVVGGGGRGERYENLRRRMEGEVGRATGVEGREGAGRLRRGVLGGVVDQFRGGS